MLRRKMMYLILICFLTAFLSGSMTASVFAYNATVSATDQQTVKGLGGGFPWRGCGTPLPDYPLAAQAVLDMGTSVMRIYIHNLMDVFDSNGDLVDTGLADMLVSEIQWAASHGIPYNYTPGWNNLPESCYSGGYLLEQYEQAQCNAIKNMLLYFTSHGCALPLITTLTNEPSAPVRYMTTIPHDQYRRVFKLARTTLDNAGLSNATFAYGENGECMYQLAYLGGNGFPELSADPTLNAAIGAFATHTYYPSNSHHQQYRESLDTWAAGRDNWQTEYCYLGDQVAEGKDHTTGIVEHFISDMVFLKFNYWEIWQLWNFNGPAETDVLCSGNGITSMDIPPAYYVFKKIFTNVTPGTKVRTVTTDDPGLMDDNNIFMDVIAFTNDSMMLVVFVNPNSSSRSMNVNGLTGTSADVYQIDTEAPYGTDMTLISSPDISGGSISNINLAGNSVTVIETNGGGVTKVEFYQGGGQ